MFVDAPRRYALRANSFSDLEKWIRQMRRTIVFERHQIVSASGRARWLAWDGKRNDGESGDVAEVGIFLSGQSMLGQRCVFVQQ